MVFKTPLLLSSTLLYAEVRSTASQRLPGFVIDEVLQFLTFKLRSSQG